MGNSARRAHGSCGTSCASCASLLREMDRTVAVIRSLPELEQRLLRAELLEQSAAEILAYYAVEARPESIQ
jgi:hypothetical protein